MFQIPLLAVIEKLHGHGHANEICNHQNTSVTCLSLFLGRNAVQIKPRHTACMYVYSEYSIYIDSLVIWAVKITCACICTLDDGAISKLHA